jgi:hypothetical protein
MFFVTFSIFKTKKRVPDPHPPGEERHGRLATHESFETD